MGLLGQKEAVRPILTQTSPESLISSYTQYVTLPDARLQELSLNLQTLNDHPKYDLVPERTICIWIFQRKTQKKYIRSEPKAAAFIPGPRPSLWE